MGNSEQFLLSTLCPWIPSDWKGRRFLTWPSQPHHGVSQSSIKCVILKISFLTVIFILWGNFKILEDFGDCEQCTVLMTQPGLCPLWCTAPGTVPNGSFCWLCVTEFILRGLQCYTNMCLFLLSPGIWQEQLKRMGCICTMLKCVLKSR